MISLYAKIDDKSVRSKYVALVDCELDLKEILLPIELSRGMAINIVVLAQSIL